MDYASIIAVVILMSIVLYALLGGADYGGGMWDLLASGPRKRKQREAIAQAIGPVWEANHVWLILVIVLIFTAFPPSFGAMMTALHIPVTLVLIGIVLRGTSFVFRKYDEQRDEIHRRWSTVFGIASFLTPFFLGLCLGALTSGDIRWVGSTVTTGFFAGWTTFFALGCGLFAQGLFALLAAVYMILEVKEDPALQEDFRRRALIAAWVLIPLALIVLLLARDGAVIFYERLTAWWSPWLLAATAVAAVGTLLALYYRNYRVARLAAASEVVLILTGWCLAQYPYLIIPDITVDVVSAPLATLRLTTWSLFIGGLVLFPSLAYLLYIFKHPDTIGPVESHGDDDA